MPLYTFAGELEQWGPHAAFPRPTLNEARRYCERLARGHYENFTVASWLLPKHLRQHFFNVYAYCRWADDLADETGDRQQSLVLLDWWQRQLLESYRGRSEHPVFVALTETIEEFEIPERPFLDLLRAFRQDQRRDRYETFDELLDYCRYSANPVGHLVLYLGRCFDAENAQLADSICTGLQLANFWQDVARDYGRGRVYLPHECCRRFGYRDEMLERRECNGQFRELLAFEVERAEKLLIEGRPLVARLPRELRLDVELFVRGGLAVLQAIRLADCDVWSKRPTVNKLAKFKLLASAWLANR